MSDQVPVVERGQHYAMAPGVGPIRAVAANLARMVGVKDEWPDEVADLLLRRCHELMAGINVLEEHAVCRAKGDELHKPWCPKHSDDSKGADRG